ncbi:hypothetical protein EVAR_86109_1 [Eumeta japonica]|uniref:Uncharacterized protein n=1 Tax=Eumeta variegata TaxID=151549 RepID=A0A4C1V1W2_EUMVA|nr:hypothetical protein EVAR_86109_1 [Eumeta japonica]
MEDEDLHHVLWTLYDEMKMKMMDGIMRMAMSPIKPTWKQEDTAGLDYWCYSKSPRFNPYDRKVVGAIGGGAVTSNHIVRHTTSSFGWGNLMVKTTGSFRFIICVAPRPRPTEDALSIPRIAFT